MSTRERVAAAERVAAKEAYEAQKEQDLLWRSKAIAHEEAEAERKQKAASTTSGEPKRLNIDLEAAKNRPSKTQDIQIERPPYEGSNAFTGTALGDKSGTAYALPMDIEEAGATAQPLAGEVKETDHTPADNTAMVLEENSATNQHLAGEAQEASDVVAGHGSTTAETQSDNPLLKLDDEAAADGLNTELSMLQRVKADGEADDAWDGRVLWVYTSWLEWITCGNTLKWHFDKLNEWQTRQLKPMVDEMFTLFDKRCGKRNDNVPADALDDTLAVVSMVRDNMNEALDYLEAIDSDQPVILDQPTSETNERFTSDVQFANCEQFDHVQEQIAEDRESAERLHQELNSQSTQIASDHEYAKSVDREQHHQQPDAQIASDHEYAKSVDQEQHQQQNQQPESTPMSLQTYIQGDLVDQLTCTHKQDYPQTVVASGSGTYPKDKKARRQVNEPQSPAFEQWVKLPRYKVVTLPSEQFVIPSFAPAGGAQDADYTPAENGTTSPEEQINTGPNEAPANPLLEQQDADYAPARNATTPAEELNNTSPNEAPTNPLLEQPDASQAWKMLTSWLIEAESSFKTLTQDNSEAWYQDLCLLFAFWSQWMECGGDEIWRSVQGCDVVPYATFASGVHSYFTRQLGEVSRETDNVYQWMNAAKDFAEKQEQACIREEQRHAEEQEQARIREEQRHAEEQEQARMRDEQRPESMFRAHQMQQQQQLAKNQQAEKQEEQARISEEQRQDSIHTTEVQQQQPARDPPVEQGDKDMYGNHTSGEGSRKETTANSSEQRQAERVEAKSNAGGNDYTQEEMGENIWKVFQEPSSAPVGLLRSHRNKPLRTTRKGRPHVGRTRPINTAGGEASPPSEKPAETARWATNFRQKALDEGWRDDDIDLEGEVRPLEWGPGSHEAALVLVTTWLGLNDETIKNFQRQFKRSEYKDTATSMHHGPLFMGKIKLISARYDQLRDYACVKRGKTEDYDWNLNKISLNDIKKNDLEQLVMKNQEFMLTLKDALLEEDGPDQSSKKVELDACRNIVLEAYANVMAVARSIGRATSSSAHDDSDSELSDASETVKAAIAKEDAKKKASRPN